MIGKAEWFRERRYGWGLTPVTWQGWIYVGATLAIVSIPFCFFVLNDNVVAALIWMPLSIAGIAFDTGRIMQSMKQSNG